MIPDCVSATNQSINNRLLAALAYRRHSHRCVSIPIRLGGTGCWSRRRNESSFILAIRICSLAMVSPNQSTVSAFSCYIQTSKLCDQVDTVDTVSGHEQHSAAGSKRNETKTKTKSHTSARERERNQGKESNETVLCAVAHVIYYSQKTRHKLAYRLTNGLSSMPSAQHTTL